MMRSASLAAISLVLSACATTPRPTPVPSSAQVEAAVDPPAVVDVPRHDADRAVVGGRCGVGRGGHDDDQGGRDGAQTKAAQGAVHGLSPRR